MRTKLFIVFVVAFLSLHGFAQELQFNSEGKFKIVQFTDIHYVAGSEHSDYSLRMMNRTLDLEKPDLVVFTGDVVVGKPIAQGWDEVLAPVTSRNIPYLVMYGNHDDESEWKRDEIARYVVQKPGLVNKQAAIDGIKGYMNAAIALKDRQGKQVFTLYTFDSHAYSSLPKVKGYGWFDISQINWYRQKSQEIKRQVGDTIPALAFFHIPLPEYKLAFDDLKNKRVGVRYEAECSPSINTGMFAAMLQEGDVMGTFVGHDHANDYLVEYYGIALAYGCWSGSKNTYTRSQNGARIILLEEGSRGFETYIRQHDGSVVYQASFPFVKK